MPRYVQCKENVVEASKELTSTIHEAVAEANRELAETGRVLVRPSGTEPVVRVLVEAENESVAKEACGRIAALVSSELG
jgi:phosphoglucosamine mutase